MKFLTQTLATILICFAAQYFLPWWTLALASCAVGYYFNNSGFTSFAAGFIGVGILWFGMAYYLDTKTLAIMTEKINRLFPVNVYVLLVVVGGLTGGFAALTGTLLKGKKLARY